MKNKKAELPGWSIVVMLIIGLFLLVVILYIAFRSKNSMVDIIKSIADIF